MTKEERKLWYDFLNTYPVKFRKQSIIGNYIADFYCHSAKLVVELDGSGHFYTLHQIKDKERTEYFNSLGIDVIRFTNLDILKKFNGVCLEIDKAVKERIDDLKE